MNQEKIGKIIAKKRKELHMTQSDLAEKLYITNKTVSRWETGKYMPDLSMIVTLSELLNLSVYELLTGEENSNVKDEKNNVETEIRCLFSLSEEEKIIKYLKKFDDLIYKGKFYEKTIQYNHPDNNIDFYSKDIDARFRVRLTENENIKKCIISYKRRGNNFLNEDINNEEEVEVSVNYNDFSNLSYILEKVLNMKLIESYERYRYVFYNDDIEIDVDVYPFMIAIEIENKSKDKDPKTVVLYYLNKLNFSLEETYKLSWDDKYKQLCNEQSIKIEKIVSFDKKMPKFENYYFSK